MDQLQLPQSRLGLHRLLARDCFFDCGKLLAINQLLAIITPAKFRAGPVAVLPRTGNKFRSNADIEDAMRFVGHDVNETAAHRCAVCTHARRDASFRWHDGQSR